MTTEVPFWYLSFDKLTVILHTLYTYHIIYLTIQKCYITVPTAKTRYYMTVNNFVICINFNNNTLETPGTY